MIKIWPNTGQIAGIPTNPRLIKDHRFEKLVQSIKDRPEMLEMRECLVVPYADEYVAIAGNMRLRVTSDAASVVFMISHSRFPLQSFCFVLL